LTLEVGGRLSLPLTGAMPTMSPISKGPMVLLTKVDDQNFGIRRIVPMVSVPEDLGAAFHRQIR